VFARSLYLPRRSFFLFGPRGAGKSTDLEPLRLFATDYPMAKGILLYGGKASYEVDGIRVLPLREALPQLRDLLA